MKANTNVKLWMSLGSGHDTEEMAETFGVDADQTDFTRTLQRGEAVVSTADGEPVPISLPPVHVDKSGAATGVEDRLEALLDEVSWTERERPQRFWDAVGGQPPESTGYDEDDAGEEMEREVGEVAEALLASIVDEPFLSISERYDAIDAGTKTGNKAKDELLAGAEIYVEHDDQLQEFDSGRKIVVNGIEDIHYGHCTDLRERADSRSNISEVEETVRVDSIRYNKTVFDAGKPVASNGEHCRLYEEYEPDSSYGLAEETVDRIYEECWGIRDVTR